MSWRISKEGLNDAIGSMLSSLRAYDQKPHWKCVCERCFTEEELKHIQKAELAQGDYGLSVCLTMTNGAVKYITTDTRPKDSMDGKYRLKTYAPGDPVDPSTIVLRALKNVAKEEDPEAHKDEKDMIIRVLRRSSEIKPEPQKPTEVIDINDPLGVLNT